MLTQIINSFNTYKNIKINTILHKSEYFVNADVSQINRAFQNLILNAINSIEESNEEKGMINLKS